MESPDTPLKRWRLGRKFTPAQAAAEVGVSLPTWSRWENGRRKVPPGRARALEARTGIRAEVLCPDFPFLPAEPRRRARVAA